MTNVPPPQGPYQQQPQVVYSPPPKKRRKWPWVLLGIFVVLVVIVIAASVSGNSDNGKVVATSGVPSVKATVPAEALPPFGASIQVVDGNSKMVITVNAPQQTAPSDGSSVTGTLYASDVVVQCTQGTCSDINPLNFSAATSDGTHVNLSLGAVDNQLSSDTIPAGQKVVGQVGFDVPTGQTVKSISFSSGFSADATWGTR